MRCRLVGPLGPASLVGLIVRVIPNDPELTYRDRLVTVAFEDPAVAADKTNGVFGSFEVRVPAFCLEPIDKTRLKL